MENSPVTGIAHSLTDAQMTLVNVPDHPGVAALIFGSMARAGINVGTIAQTASDNGATTDVSFTVGRSDVERVIDILKTEQNQIGFLDIQADKNIAKISLVGLGMRSRPGVAARMFETLAEKGINIKVVETSEISISVLIAEEYLELALRSLHAAFSLDQTA